MVESVRATAPEGVEIVCAVDDDDLGTIAAIQSLELAYRSGPLLTKTAPWNQASQIANGDILMMCADDVVFRTPGWNLMVEEAFAACPDKILMVYGDDGWHGQRFSTFPAISRRWKETVGYFTHPAFPGEQTDTWLFDVSGMIGRRKFLPFVNEHLHFLFGKAEKDHTYQIAEDLRKRTNPAVLYRQLLPQRKADAEKLRLAMIQP